MTVKEIKEYLTGLPTELDNYEIVFSEVGIMSSRDKTWYRKDQPLNGMFCDSANEEIIFCTKETFNEMNKLSE